jgi:hypothetical protein
MKKIARGMFVAALAAGAFAAAPAALAAHAGSDSHNPGSVLSGTNLNTVVNAPITVCGNSVALVGLASTKGCGAAGGGSGSATSGSSSKNAGSVLSGTNGNTSVNAPIVVCDNAISSVGVAKSNGCGGAAGAGKSSAHSGSTSDNPGTVGSGSNINTSSNSPVVACGNPVSVIGLAHTPGCGAGGSGSSK